MKNTQKDKLQTYGNGKAEVRVGMIRFGEREREGNSFQSVMLH